LPGRVSIFRSPSSTACGRPRSAWRALNTYKREMGVINITLSAAHRADVALVVHRSVQAEALELFSVTRRLANQ